MIATALPDGIARPLLLGLSGGLDSSVLLQLLAASPLREAGLRAIHVHHGLHADADAWAGDCQRACDELGVPLTIVRVVVDDARGEGREAAARRARHSAFVEAMAPNEVLVLAHQRDDQAETFLLRALRASGPDALGAMHAWRAHGPGWLWRPLLGLPRTQLVEYARRRRLQWIEDPSNEDTTLDRNFLRRHIMPALRERWPQADAAFARSAALMAEASELLAEGDALALVRAGTVDPQVLAVAALQDLPPARRTRVLRRWIDRLGLPPPPGTALARIDTELLTARADAEAEVAWTGAIVRAWRAQLHAAAPCPPLPRDWCVQWNGQAPQRLPGGGELALQGHPGFEAPLSLHARRGGERITLPGRTHSHALKHVLQDLGVPPWTRERLPLLSDAQGALLAAGDRVYSAAFDRWLRVRGARLVWSD